ncbi:MAG TPA: arabinofuranosidase catalytic domain-containing protein [Actinophytocola sp.]|uniref:arabinofuranosidase catalytic domain-containing protein n=1 Tax=Actinophytocola sp. TaxID=1872138 RepID=UPI002DDD3472|nr:arabinofuranosidase catalytic domain-containing protein [Actinophytocola sp.]HEV2784500.1 arabinofuranosidase catalytic domain-containing protein [Actinophytocola sp.]
MKLKRAIPGCLGAAALVGATLVQLAPPATAAGTGPCDIYAAGGTPCVAAHSTVRALFGSYNGNLYQVRRSSDNTTRDIGLLAEGGVANAAAQDSFCAGTSCVITVVYDQAGRGNDLWYQGSTVVPGSSQSRPANATSESLTVGGAKAYSLFINPSNSYWRDGHLTGVPTGSAPEGMYMVTSGTHVNGGCCFDYGNSETTRTADGPGAMDAINFSTQCWFGGCSGTGPWVQADLEFGLYSGGSQSWNPNQRAFTSRFVTATLKNNGTSRFAMKGSNAQSGSLFTLWDGALPPGYSPMRKQGAIVLGSGGDCCKPGGGANLSAGTFYEGAMVSGYPSDATENAVQANIVAAGYGSGGSGTTGAVRAVASGRCLDVNGATTTPGTQVQIWDCHGGSNQSWTRTASGQLTVYSGSNLRCLDASGAGTTNGTPVIIWTCHGGVNQQWQVNPNGTITSVQSGLCMDVSGAGTANGTRVQLWTCNGQSNQQWTLG